MKGEVELRNRLCRGLPKSTGVVLSLVGFHSAMDRK